MLKVKVAGGVQKYEVILMFNLMNKDLISNLDITYYDMPNNCAWNGGRINRSIELTEKHLNTFNLYNQGFDLGFTNQVILDVGDEVGNQLLKMVAENNPNKKHGVILVSETLRRYIRRTYPELKLTYSITGHPTTDQLNFEGYYKELEAKYDIIVPKYSHLDAILELMQAGKLDASKYEILINDNCDSKCQFYSEHFAQISHMNTAIKAPWEEDWNKAFQIEVKPKTKPGIQKTAHCVQDNLKSDYLRQFYDCGVRYFKISGRDLDDNEFRHWLPIHLTQVKNIE